MAGSVAHLAQYEDLPDFVSVIALSLHTSKKIADDYKAIAVLELSDMKMFIVSTKNALCSMDWFQLHDTQRRKGYILAGSATAEQIVFEMLEYGRAKGGDSVDQKSLDRRFIADVIANSQPIGIFTQMVRDAVASGASDIHIEVRGEVAVVRVRVDGVMRKTKSFPAEMMLDAVSTAFTVLAEELSRTDAAFNVRLAQAAMIPIELGARRFTLRYQSHPAVGGVDVVLRILRTSNTGGASEVRTLASLGYHPSQVEALEMAIASAWGGVFIAGITGSGKTTTLNAMLLAMAEQGGRKLISIEDPVEYVVKGVSHLSIQRTNNDSQNPFLNAMRAFLRLDPDIGMFGEIRDELSGEIAQAAIETGHKILTTVHATSALGIVSRLTSKMIGLDRLTVCNPEFISALVYQVLLPRSCPECKRPAKSVMSSAELDVYERLFGLDPSGFHCASDRGCDKCRVSGVDYSEGIRQGTAGVKVAAEVVLPDEALLTLLAARQDMEARNYCRSLRRSPFDSPDMQGKEAWGHALYDVSIGEVDPFYFQNTFGNPKSFAHCGANPARHGVSSE